MAIYHCQVKPVSRAKGHSSTAGAAYRSCSKIRDERTGELHDYSRKRGLEHAEIVLSTEAARQDIQWARDRSRLWNAAEAAEVRKDGRPAREYEVALPHELDKVQRAALAREFARELANRYQCAVDIAIHKPHSHGDARNFHAHLYATTRQVTPNGLGDKTLIERSDADRRKLGLGSGKDEITQVRERWAACTNRALENARQPGRVDHRSLEAQGIDRTPTSHKGSAVCAIEARGGHSVVLERMREQEASARLARAAELGRIEREEEGIREEILDLSADVAAALRNRTDGRNVRPDQAEIGRRAVENWLSYKNAKERAPAPENTWDHGASSGLAPADRRDRTRRREGSGDDYGL
jgi:ATP-dependent exoDNAse (exonuclease V) alpha subunit